MLDILIAVLGSGLMLLSAYLGVHVTLHPADSARERLLYKLGFCACALFSCILMGIQTYRNERAQTAVRTQLDEIQNNTKQPPTVQVTTPTPVVTVVGPPQHSHVSFETPLPPGPNTFFPFVEGKTPALNVLFLNTGDFPVIADRWGAVLVVAPSRTKMVGAFSKYESMIVLNIAGGTISPHTGERDYHTFIGKPLTKEDAANINSGDADICVVAKVQWHDETGIYQTDGAQCFAISPMGSNWYVSSDHNRERVLH